jgi:hypothetical protein
MKHLALIALAVAATFAACRKPYSDPTFAMIRADRAVSPSAFPIALDPARVGTYPEETKSGAGYFYDDVLEYRVWFHPEHGAIPFNGTNDYFMTFATYEPAEAVSKTLPGAEEPLVLIRQLESINEPEPGRYIHDRKPRITEWQVRWLAGSKRTPTSIQEFMQHPRPQRD